MTYGTWKGGKSDRPMYINQEKSDNAIDQMFPLLNKLESAERRSE